ncbi:MAG: magnesium transporter [Oscillospiraceae bacterium]|jgi:magnesium transporter
MDERVIEDEKVLKKLLEEKNYSALRSAMADMQAQDVAAIMDDMEDEDSLKMFRILPKDMAVDVFANLELDDQQYIIQSLSDREASNIIDNLMADDATDLLEEMPANIVDRLLKHASPDTRRYINKLLKYPDGSAGSLMTVEYVDLKEAMTVQQAISRIRDIGMDSETVNICYVLGEQRTLVGTVMLRSLVINSPDKLVGDIMDDNVISIGTLTDQEDAAKMFQKYDLTAMPVVDNENRMVGIITIDDVVDIMQEEVTEDIEKMAAIVPSGDVPYFKVSVWTTFKKRIPWLLILMVSATITGAIITKYENALAAYVVLTSYIPMIMDTGGNAGSQASVSIIRAISLGEVAFKDIFKALWKEMRVGVLCGVALAACNFVKMILLDRVTVIIAAVVCITLVFDIFLSKVIGCSLPLLAKKIGFDPAVMASPLITTIIDATSLSIYFAVATQLLGL